MPEVVPGHTDLPGTRTFKLIQADHFNIPMFPLVIFHELILSYKLIFAYAVFRLESNFSPLLQKPFCRMSTVMLSWNKIFVTIVNKYHT
jgi:hypothetical protein